MLIAIFVLIFIVWVQITIVMLVQESKGGGLASGFSSANQMIGVTRTTEFLEKATWVLAVSLMVLCLGAAALGGRTTVVEEETKSSLEQYLDEGTAPTPQIQPQQPAEQPQQPAAE
jgi:preprotein translocase subunit SecG